MNLIQLFPTPVMHKKCLIDSESASNAIDKVFLQDQISNSYDQNLSHTVDCKIEDFISDEDKANVLQAVKELGSYIFGQDLVWQFKEAWANVLKTGGEQAMHLHANSFISGVLYLTDSHPSANLVFHKSSGGQDFVFSNFNDKAKLNVFNTPRQQIEVINAGDLILFPSYLQHSVPENEGPQRLSLAFNAIPDALETWGYKISFDHAVVSGDG